MLTKLKHLYGQHKDDFLEWYRLYFHTLAVTALIFFNITFLFYNSLLSYFSILLNSDLSIPFVHLHQWPWIYFVFMANIPLFTWFYSTITQSIKKGYKNIIDWSKTKKGRILAGVLNALPFITLSWVFFARYVKERYTPFLSTIRVESDFLTVNTLDTLIIFLYLLPVLITPIFIAGITSEFMKKKSLGKQFYKWEFPLLARQSFNLKENSCDVIIGWDKQTKKPIVLKENERFLHELVVGATGSGKTSTSILPRIALDLVRVARGYPCSIILIEPKGDAVEDVLKIAKNLKVPDHLIKVIDPTKKTKHSIKFNPFSGDMAAAAEGFRGTLNSLTGDQDAFFAGQQEETAALFTMLAKIRFGNLANISHVQRMYTEPRYLADIAEQVREEVDRLKAGIEGLTKEEKTLMVQYDRVVSYFENEVLDYKTFTNKQGEREPRYYQHGPYKGRQEVENKKDKFVTGAKKYLNDISMNAMLTELMIAEGDEEVLDLDDFLDKGGILLVNTALGELEELSILLGQFMIRQIQSAVFRRPREENGYKRIPTFLSIDEFPLFANEKFERLLTLGRSYKVGTLIALQSLGQLERIVAGYKETIMANASTKTVFGRGTFEDNEAFSNQFGEEERVEESLNESTSPMTQENPSWGFRHNTQRMLMPRFSPSEIQELAFKHCIVQPVNEDGTIGDAREAVGKFVNETGILKKFVNINKIELSTKKHKGVDVSMVERTKTSALDEITNIEQQTENDTATNNSNQTDISSDLDRTAEETDTFTIDDILGLEEQPKLDNSPDTESNEDSDEFEFDDTMPDFSNEKVNDSTAAETSFEQDFTFDEKETESQLEHGIDITGDTSEEEQEFTEVEELPEEQELTKGNDEIPLEKTEVKEVVAIEIESKKAEGKKEVHKQLELSLSDDELFSEPGEFKPSTPSAAMEEAINELLNKTFSTKEKSDKQYNMQHEDKKPKTLDALEDDNL